MAPTVKAPGTNPTVVSAESYIMSYGDNGRTFVTLGTDKNSFVDYALPTGLVEGFRVRVGVNSAGRPARISNGRIALPRKSSLMTTGYTTGLGNEWIDTAVSYDPGAFLDLVWDPGGDDIWRVVAGAGLWTKPLDPCEYHLRDIPAMGKLDFGKPTATTSEWTPFPMHPTETFSIVSTSSFEVASTQEMYDLFRPGVPIRWLESTVDEGWSYGIVESFDAAFSRAVVTFSGVAMNNATPLALEVGPRESLRRITLTFPGNFNAATNTALIENLNNTFLTWTEGDASLVRVSVICIKADTGGTPPAVNVSIGGLDAVSGPGLLAKVTREYSGVDMDPTRYQIAFDDSIEVSVTNHGGGNGGPSSGDAEDMTVELLFVQDRRQAFWSHDDAVNATLNMVISGMGAGVWATLGSGVHAVTPTAYVKQGWQPSTGTSTGTYSTKQERWVFATTGSTPTQFLRINAFARRAIYTTGSPSHGPTIGFSTFKIQRTAGYSMYDYVTLGATGYIRNQMMRSVFLDGVTFTWWKLGTVWGSAFN